MTTSLTNAGITLYDTGETAGNNIWLDEVNDALVYLDRNSLQYLTYALSDETSGLATGTGVLTVRAPFKMNVTAVRASVSEAPTGSTIIVDINENGSSILSTKLSIDATEKTSTTAATAAVISDSTIADDAEITFDIDQVGSTNPGKGLKVTLICKVST